MKRMKPQSGKRYLMPNYQIAKERLIELIVAGGYEEGDRIPSMTKLADALGVAKISVQKAIGMLVDEGVLRTVAGSGCFIAERPVREAAANVEAEDDDAPFTIYAPRKKVLRLGLPLRETPRFDDLWRSIVKGYERVAGDVVVEIAPFHGSDVARESAALDILPIEGVFLPYYVGNKLLFDPGELGAYRLEESAIYSEFVQAARFDGRVWAVPTLASAGCRYVAKDERVVEALRDETDFWGYLDRLKWMSSQSFAANFESLVGSYHNLFSYLLMAGRVQSRDLDQIKSDLTETCGDFLDRFADYFRDSRLFLPSQSGPRVRRKFAHRKIAVMMGSLYWLDKLADEEPISFHLIGDPLGEAGKTHVDAQFFGVSITSQYPLECQDFLNHLAGSDVLRTFAQSGRTTANRKANEHFRFKAADAIIPGGLDGVFESGSLWQCADPHIFPYMNTVVANEFSAWRDGRLETEDLLENLERKTKFFYEGIKRREELARPA